MKRLKSLPWGWISVLGALVALQLYAFMHRTTFQYWLIEHPMDTWLGMIAPKLQDLITLTVSIIIEALPFVVLGVTLSVLIRMFVSHDILLRLLPRNVFLRRVCISFFGVAMPVCECGNVPVARGLMAKGFSVGDATVFLLAAPIINPVTFIATWQAFSFDHSVAFWRIGAAFVIANLIGFIVGCIKQSQALLTEDFKALCETHEHRPSLRRGVGMFREELWLLMRLLCFGALVAAMTQIIVPRDVIVAIGSDPVLGILAMLVLAFVISICSSVDAFFALAYVGTFSTGAILTFLIAGPMVDIKMLSIMKTTFTWRLLLLITALVGVLAAAVGLVVLYA